MQLQHGDYKSSNELSDNYVPGKCFLRLVIKRWVCASSVAEKKKRKKYRNGDSTERTCRQIELMIS